MSNESEQESLLKGQRDELENIPFETDNEDQQHKLPLD